MRKLCLLLLIWGPANAVESINWDKSVITLDLIVGVEQLVHFDGPGTVGLPPLLADQNVFRNMFASSTAYWKALQPFKTERIKVKFGGDVVLFDVSATSVKKPPKSVEPKRVLFSVAEPLAEPASVEAANQRPDDVTMFDLLRYASQIDYAPERAVKPVAGLHEVEAIDAELSRLYNHPMWFHIDVFAKNAYSAAGFFVTALHIHNRSEIAIRIDPAKFQHSAVGEVNAINNRFVAAAMVERDMDVHGSGRDYTMLYIVTHQPFGDVINLGAAQ